MTTGIEVRSLQAGYDDNIVIDELNLTIPKDSITALIGANGCGKSTLLKTICRILQPMGGSVYLDGRSIHERNTAELAREMAILPQQPTAPQGLTVRELVAYGRSPYRSGLWGRLSSKDREMIDWALSATGLTSLADRPIDQLSGVSANELGLPWRWRRNRKCVHIHRKCRQKLWKPRLKCRKPWQMLFAVDVLA